VPPAKFVVFAQNHDQIGNRMLGERLSQLVSLEASKLASGLVLLSPFVPLLFMGDEYGETAPFQYFVSHSEENLIEAVRRGRREEFMSFNWTGEPPDPQAEETFKRSKLNHDLKKEACHRTLLDYHKQLIHLRKTLPALRTLSKDKMDVVSFQKESVLSVRRWSGNNEVLEVFNFNDHELRLIPSVPQGIWRKRLDSSEPRWMGRGSRVPDVIESASRATLTLQPHAVLLFEKEFQD
jgi:maltooligosyltrehalose trehalohydrolase